jgi:hypothetical protein
MRAGLQDRYATFVFVAETKGGDNLFLYGNRLPIGVAVRVWLTYTWRTAVAPIAILIGTVTAATIEHQNITDAIVTLESDQWVYFTASAGMVTSIWAMRERLADRYGSFRFSTYPKSVPV